MCASRSSIPGHYAVMFDRSLVDAADVDLAAAQAAAGSELSQGVATLADPHAKSDPAGAELAAWSLVHGFAMLWLNHAVPPDVATAIRWPWSSGSRACSSTARRTGHRDVQLRQNFGHLPSACTPPIRHLRWSHSSVCLDSSSSRSRACARPHHADVSRLLRVAGHSRHVPVSFLVAPRLAGGYRLSDDHIDRGLAARSPRARRCDRLARLRRCGDQEARFPSSPRCPRMRPISG